MVPSRHSTHLTATLVAALVVSLAAPVLADIGPGPDDTSTCTASRREQPGVDCEECADDQCDSRFEGTYYEYVCTRDEGDSLVEVWCDGEPREIFGAGGGCGMTDRRGAAPLGGGILGAALLLVVWLTRTRSRRC